MTIGWTLGDLAVEPMISFMTATIVSEFSP